jgi:hypothetical protein
VLSIGFCSPCVLVSLRYACGPRAAVAGAGLYGRLP